MEPTRLAGSRNVLTLVLAVLGLVLGEAPIAGASFGAKAVVGYLLPTVGPNLQLLTAWLLASVAVALLNYLVFAVPILYGSSKVEDAAVAALPSDGRSRWAINTLGSGRVAGFVLASIIGGALPVAWWCRRNRHPHAWLLSAIAAVILATSFTAAWLGLFTPTARDWVLTALVLVLVVALAVAVLRSPTWNVLAYLYDGLFALRPHRDLVVRVAGDLPSTGQILDAGCGTGWLGRFASQGTAPRLTGIDVSPTMARIAARRAQYAEVLVGSVQRINLPDASVDSVASINVLYAVDSPQAALRECARVMRPGGLLLLANPVSARLAPLVPAHFAVATWRDNLRLLFNLPRLLAWVGVLLVRRPRFRFIPTVDLQHLVEQAGFAVNTVESVYAGLGVLITATRRSEGGR